MGLDLEAKGTGGGTIWAWMVLEVVVAGRVVTALGRGGALETSDVLLLELEGVPERGEGTLPLPLCFLLVTRVKATSSAFFFFFFLFINLLHGARSQSVVDYLQQVAYSFRGLRGQKPPSQADKDIITVRRDQK